MLDVRARNVEFIGRDALRILKNPNHFHVFRGSLPEHVRDDRYLIRAELRQFVYNKCFNSNVLQAYGIDHTPGCFAHPRREISRSGKDRESFDDDAAESIQVDKVSKLDPVTKSAAGSNDGVL